MENFDTNIVKGIVYSITNKNNNMKYVGQTLTHMYHKKKWYPTGATYRWARHITTRRSEMLPLYVDIRTFGPDTFQLDILEYCEVKDLNDREKHWISNFDTVHPNGYNIQFGTTEKNSSTKKILLSKIEHKSNEPIPHIKTYKKQICVKRGIDRIKFFEDKKIEEVDIRPINRNGEYNNIRLLIAVAGSDERYRIQFGKKPLKDVAFAEIQKLLNDLNVDPSQINIDPNLRQWLDDKDVLEFPEVYKLYIDEQIRSIHICSHYQQNHYYIRIAVQRQNDKSWKHMRKHVLGRRKEDQNDIYIRVMRLVKQLQNLNNNSIYIIDKFQCQQQQAAG